GAVIARRNGIIKPFGELLGGELAGLIGIEFREPQVGDAGEFVFSDFPVLILVRLGKNLRRDIIADAHSAEIPAIAAASALTPSPAARRAFTSGTTAARTARHLLPLARIDFGRLDLPCCFAGALIDGDKARLFVRSEIK